MENSSPVVVLPARLPDAYDQANVDRNLAQWQALGRKASNAMGQWMLDAVVKAHPVRAVLEAVFGNSPYLSRLLLLYPDILHNIILEGADKSCADILSSIRAPVTAPRAKAALMRALRIGKNKIALAIALADIMQLWTLERITQTLSAFAEISVSVSIDAILQASHEKSEIILPYPIAPSKESGIVVLGMGKLGGEELNYSSDIDLILFYEAGRLSYPGRRREQPFMNYLARELVSIMQDRTESGYVFRTDIRLRPDPASTPPIMTTDAAYYYYESVGQNWERAAMIKARPVAGDREAGERFLNHIFPFMWRRNLDFAAINDIHSIKRQMDSRLNKTIQIKGHNIKLGMGGIREIEFYAQIHQLIWGGREAVLRTRSTCDTLSRLAECGLVDGATKSTLSNAYVYLRTVEHRLQMVNDEQTHSLPLKDEGLASIAYFTGYEDVASFESDTLAILNRVHAIYASSFKPKGPVEANLGSMGNLVFTGVGHDAETLETLRDMGFSQPETLSEIIMGWHHGSRRATRSKRARELLTEMMPHLLESLAKTAHPDNAFIKFDEFLSKLPAGVQLFSLFSVNPHLLQLIADIMGSALMLADTLSKTPSLLEAALYEDFYAGLPSRKQLLAQLNEGSWDSYSFEEGMNRLRRFHSEKQFQVGVQLLKAMITSEDVGAFLSDLADIVIQKTFHCVTVEFTKTYGVIHAGHFGIIGLGKLGSREMTFGSDIDLVFIYDVVDFESHSDGKKRFSASVYYNRLAQRFVGALTALGIDGKLYEVDTRLRPSGVQGLLAVSTQALTHYFNELAWTFEFMAFTKARVISAEKELEGYLEHFIQTQLSKPRDPEKLRRDVADMRDRIAQEHGTSSPWDIKYAPGGLMDIDFLAQYLLLLHANSTSPVKPASATRILDWLASKGHIERQVAQQLTAAIFFLNSLFHMLRLCSNLRGKVISVPEGLKTILIETVAKIEGTTKLKDFGSLELRLIEVERSVRRHYIALLKPDNITS